VKSNNTHLNILISYAYCGKSKSFNDLVIGESMKGIANVMIDSGAFTIYNSKTVSKLNLDSYCNYLEDNAHKVEKYVMLDVVKDKEKTKANYETMLNRGFNPMFVFTEYDNDWEYVRKAVKNQKHLCVAGGVTNRGEWMLKRYQDVYKNTKADIHGLGFVQYNDIFRLPLHSVDSSSWVQTSQVYGILSYFDNGIKGVAYRDILTRKKKMPQKLQMILEQLKVTPKVFSNTENHKGSKSIATLINTMAYIEFQKYAKRLGLNLFLAIANAAQANSIFFLNEELTKGTLTYEKYKNVKL
jgi:hypothetical protein